jgi:hypothetical protein
MAGLGLRLIGYFLLKMIPLLIQGIVQKRIVNMNGDKTEDAIVRRTLSTDSHRVLHFREPPVRTCMRGVVGAGG